MCLCNRQDQVETLSKWCDAVPRDLPSFYDLSLVAALKYGGVPNQSHSKDCLLNCMTGLVFFTKKFANIAVCRILVDAMSKFSSQDCTEDQKQAAIDKFCDIYKCFLRLNCPVGNSLWQSQQTRRYFSSGFILEADALCDAFQRLFVKGDDNKISITQMSWEAKMMILRAATKKGQAICAAMEAEPAAKKAKKRKSSEIETSRLKPAPSSSDPQGAIPQQDNKE